MLSTLGFAVCRLRWSVLGAGLVVFVLAAGWGSGVFGDLAGSGFSDPGSESSRADQIADRDLPRDGPDVVLLYRSNELTADDPEYRSAVEDDLVRLSRSDVVDVRTPWSTGSPRLVSADKRSVAVPLRLAGADESARDDVFERIRGELSSPPAGFHVGVGGGLAIDDDINNQVESDIRKAELLSMPMLLVLLVVLLGGIVAATVPLVIGAAVIAGAFALLRGLTQVSDVSVFSVNVVVMLGLGLAVDYALLMITRFREELRQRDTVAAAIAQTVATTGRTVIVSGAIVATTLGTLLLFPQVYFRSIGFAGIAITALAVLAALTILPAILAVLGPRVDALAVLPGWGRGRRNSPGAWFRFAKAVMRRPIAVLLVVVPLLLLLGAPFLRVQFGQIDHRALPESTESRQVAERLAAEFPGGGQNPIDVVVTFSSGPPGPATTAALGEYVERLRGLPGITSATVTAEAGTTARVSAFHPYDEESAQARRLVADIRATTPPTGGQALVGGNVAELVDLVDNLRKILPFMVATMFVVTLLVLFLAFGSVALPLAAMVMSVLSMSASFGAIVWVFQEGHLSGLLGFTATGAVEATQPILMFAIAFSLATDYAVFLISRVREEWDRTRDNTLAVATGMEHTAPIITSAALLLVVVVGAFSLSGISFIKMIGLGLAFTILIDATVVRGILVPATMGLLGPANWWLPPALAGVARRFGIRDAPSPGQMRGPVPARVPEPVPGPQSQVGKAAAGSLLTRPARPPATTGADLAQVDGPGPPVAGPPGVAGPTQLSPEFLTRVLRHGRALPPGRQVALSTVLPVPGGRLSRTARVLLDYDSVVPGAPQSLVVKTPAIDPGARAVAASMGMYAREVYFYRELAPHVAIRTPRCWSSSLDPATGDFSLLIEDFPNAAVHDQTDGCPPEDALLAVRELARLHAATWDDPALGGLRWLNHLDPVAAERWQEQYRGAWRAFTSRPEAVLAPELLAVGAELDRSDFAGWVCANDGPRALVHADFHLANLLFATDAEGRREIVTVDWQLLMHAHPLIDVAYFAGRMSTGARQAIERDLVGAYHASLVEAGITGYSLEQCWEDYTRWIWFGVFSAVVVSAGCARSAEELRRHTSTVARYLEQALDHEAVRYLTRTSA